MANTGLNISGIYKIESKVHPDRIYIGSAVNFRHRKNIHFRTLKKNIHKNPKLQAHYNKYGEGDLSFSVIAICDKKELIPENKIIWIEQFFIDAYKPWFNIAKIAGSCTGTKRSEETKNKLKGNKNGLGNKGNLGGTPWNKGLKLGKQSPELIEKRVAPMRGRKRPPFSEEWIKNISEGHKGIKQSEESNRKRSEKLKGRIVTQETIDKIRNAQIGIPKPKPTEEGRKNLSNAMKDWWRWARVEANIEAETERYFKERANR